MNPTVIRHKYTMSMAVAIFWRMWLGVIKLPTKTNWSKIERPDLLLLGYDKVEAQPVAKLLRRKYSLGEYWQEQRVFKFYKDRIVLVEILLVGLENILESGRTFRECYWAPAAARYRPVQTMIFRTAEEAKAYYEDLSEQGRALHAEFYRPFRVTYFGDWVYVGQKQLATYWPDKRGLAPGLELPTPVWPD